MGSAKIKSTAGILVCIGFATLIGGCTSIERGMLAGGAVGAGAGAIWGGCAGTAVNAGEGTAIGAVIGGAYGGLIGADYDAHNAKDNEKKLRELENKLNDMNLKGKDSEKLQDEINALKDRIKQLENQPKGRVEEPKVAPIEGVTVKQTSRGIEMTILGDTLFKSGKAELSDKGKQTLDNVAKVVKEQFPGREIAFEGHTDTDPIKFSSWRSNWELGDARSLEVLHYMVDKHGLTPAKLSASTYGEYRPVASNATPEGKQQNRRSVIVLLSQPLDARDVLAKQPQK
ncbi:MAG: flagellar motor protein MotB [Candidatus Sumerlaeota bacterium]|nr:flagellar motor protein MotB [Candidatus Sumerlaeota bacterium]